MEAEITAVASRVGQLALQQQIMLTTVESCTGGQVAAAITDIPGSSRWFESGFVTYSNQAKQQMVGVPREALRRFGAVSAPVVAAMVKGGCQVSRAQLGVALSGIAGPGGGSATKPVGTVWVGWGSSEAVFTHCFHFTGTRTQIRHQGVLAGLGGLLYWLKWYRLPEHHIMTAMKEKFQTTLQ